MKKLDFNSIFQMDLPRVAIGYHIFLNVNSAYAVLYGNHKIPMSNYLSWVITTLCTSAVGARQLGSSQVIFYIVVSLS